MRLLLVAGLLGLFFVGSPASVLSQFVAEERAQHAAPLQGIAAGTSAVPKSAAEQADISRSGSDFLQVCSGLDSGGDRDAARIGRDATCLGWVQGFAEGFLVYGELLSVPKKDRIACVPRGVTTVQIVRVIKKYLADNPGKAHRPTRYIASIALAGAFPCKAGK
ncbi:MAG TPA: Rap1a/Tai family immunity protein [Candidatus Acidoferrum sp.]